MCEPSLSDLTVCYFVYMLQEA